MDFVRFFAMIYSKMCNAYLRLKWLIISLGIADNIAFYNVFFIEINVLLFTIVNHASFKHYVWIFPKLFNFSHIEIGHIEPIACKG